MRVSNAQGASSRGALTGITVFGVRLRDPATDFAKRLSFMSAVGLENSSQPSIQSQSRNKVRLNVSLFCCSVRLLSLKTEMEVDALHFLTLVQF